VSAHGRRAGAAAREGRDFPSGARFAMGDAMAGPERELVVDAQGIDKSFGRTTVLRDLSLAVRRGESLAVFGPNGAGKSTLLRLCATLYRPTRGTLRLFGRADVGPAVRRRIGVVAHQSFLYPDLSARENLTFFARLYGLAAGERLADRWLERVALADSGSRPVRVFSRGMEQRLALARALLHEPDLLLLDEPWTGLDAAAAELLTALLRALHREGRSVIAATHDFERGLASADRALILHRGRIIWDAAVDGDTRAAVDATYRRLTAPAAA
jgi:ABC-type multidrug transport system ATPase subunit